MLLTAERTIYLLPRTEITIHKASTYRCSTTHPVRS